MDDDDLSDPMRFEKQVAFLEKNPDIMIVGTFIQKIDPDGNPIGELHYPLTSGQIRWGLFFRNSVGHASTMIRRSIFSEYDFSYSESLRIASDWKFFADVIQQYRIASIPEVLYFYRRYPGSITIREPLIEQKNIFTIVSTQVRENTGLELPEELVQSFIRPRLVKNVAEGKIICKATKALHLTTKKWELTDEDSRRISANVASRIRLVWQTLKYPCNLFPYVFYSLWIDPGVIFRKISNLFNREVDHDSNIS